MTNDLITIQPGEGGSAGPLSVRHDSAWDGIPSDVELCSRSAGWKSLNLRRYRDPAVVEAFDIPPRDAQLILMVKSAAKTSGANNIECSDGASGWRPARYRDGDVALTPPGRGVRLRWSNLTCHQTVQVLIPNSTMIEVAQGLGISFRPELIDRLSMHDPAIREMVSSIEYALERNAGETYAEAAAIFLATHLLSHSAKLTWAEDASSRELRIVEDYMLANLGSNISLAEIGAIAGITRFRLIRLCKQRWGETPMQRLTRLRMERGRHLLRSTGLGIIEIAIECGYTNPSHFAVAFRRYAGVSPREFRAL